MEAELRVLANDSMNAAPPAARASRIEGCPTITTAVAELEKLPGRAASQAAGVEMLPWTSPGEGQAVAVDDEDAAWAASVFDVGRAPGAASETPASLVGE